MWNRLVLQDACSLISRGISPKYLEAGGVRVLNQKCIRNHTIDYSLARRHDISKKGVKQERFIQKGDVLINSTGHGTLGRVAQVRDEPDELTTVDSHVTIVRPMVEFFYLDYFGFAAIFIEDEIKAAGQGTSGQTELSKTKLKEEFYVSFPEDFIEQQRIVAKLDAAFAEIDGAIEDTEKNLECVKQLFERCLSQTFTTADKNWQAGKITDFCSIKSGTTVDKKLEVAVGDIAYLKVADMNLAENKSGVITSSRFLNYSDVRKTQIIEADSIIFPKRGGAILTNKKRITSVPICADLNIMSVKSNGAMQPKLLFYYFLNVDMRQLGSGSSIPQINNYDIEPLSISFPTNSNEQCRLIAQLDEMLVQTNNLLDVCKKKIIEFTNLKSAILAQELQSEAA